MNIRANRDVLYFDSKNRAYVRRSFHVFVSIQNKSLFLKTKLKTPLNTNKNQNREYPCLFLKKASFTVEAAFCGTVFFLAIFSLLYLFLFLHGREKNLLLLDTAVTEYECFGTKLSSGKALLGGNMIFWEEDKKICYRKEKKKIPFLGAKMFSVNLYQQLCTSKYDGKSMVSDSSEEGSEIYVYLAENGTVYHKNRSCIYLNPTISQVLYQEIAVKRNHSGGKYYPCKCCGKGGNLPAYVFITSYGDSWHTSKTCSGLKRTVRRVPLSKVGNLPVCSKCG